MVKKILWTNTAKLSLKIIFNYYKKKASINIAQKIRNKIIKAVKLLEIQPFIVAKEPLFYDFKIEYRYLISGNYKIIYFI